MPDRTGAAGPFGRLRHWWRDRTLTASLARAVDGAAGSPIDAVIPWVDGGDPDHARRRNAAAARAGLLDPNATEPTRFVEHGELRYCLRSIRHHAPWIGPIWIVTDGQVPGFLDVERAAADGIHIVDHAAILPAGARPNFNSLAITAGTRGIPGLAPRYLLFNDDVLLLRPIRPETVFAGGRPVLRGRFKPIVGGSRQLHRRVAEASARRSGFTDRVFRAAHVPHPVVRPALDVLAEDDPAGWTANLHHRFRHDDNVSAVALHNHALLRRDLAVVADRDDHAFFGTIADDRALARARRHLKRVVRGSAVSACINDWASLEAALPGAAAQIVARTGLALACERPEPAV